MTSIVLAGGRSSCLGREKAGELIEGRTLFNLALLRYMIDLSPSFDAVIPRIGDRKEPLHAVYAKNCMVPMRRLMLDGELRIADLPGFVNARYVEQEERDRFDPEHPTFFNVNTEEDLERARALASQRNLPGSALVTDMREVKR